MVETAVDRVINKKNAKLNERVTACEAEISKSSEQIISCIKAQEKLAFYDLNY